MRRHALLAALAAVAMLLIATAPALADNHPPSGATFSWLPATPRGGDDVTFTATANDGDGDALIYRWDLDDSGTYETTGRVVTTRMARGKRKVRLVVSDLWGASQSVSKDVTIANGAPIGTFDYGPGAPHSGDDITLDGQAADPDGDAVTYSWDLDDDGTFEKSGASAHARFNRGVRRVRLRVSDPSGAATTTVGAIDVANAAPAGEIAIAAAGDDVRSGETISFSAVSVSDDDDGADAVDAAWDLDGDGEFEAEGRSAETDFRTPGKHVVSLRLTDPAGGETEVSRSVVIANRPPSAAFALSPAAPAPDQDVELTAHAADPDGGTLQLTQAWDLDGDGRFDDGGAAVVHHSFSAGEHVVRLRVTDADGGTDVAEQRLDVRAGGTVVEVSAPSSSVPAPAAIAASAPRAVPMLPFPVVRLRGRLTRTGMAVQLLSVHAGHAAHVAVRCSGRGCPRGASRLTLRRLQRWLPAGTSIEIRITQAGRIGKYTRIVVRRGRAPQRVDRCLAPGSGKPVDCR